jgi:hypothetical protein
LDQALSDGNDLRNGGSIGEFAGGRPCFALEEPAETIRKSIFRFGGIAMKGLGELRMNGSTGALQALEPAELAVVEGGISQLAKILIVVGVVFLLGGACGFFLAKIPVP